MRANQAHCQTVGPGAPAVLRRDAGGGDRVAAARGPAARAHVAHHHRCEWGGRADGRCPYTSQTHRVIRVHPVCPHGSVLPVGVIPRP